MDIICIICSLMWSYLFCHFGNSTMNHVSTISDIAYNSNWFGYPVKLQKYFIFIVLRSHKRSRFIGFYLIPCTMETFGQVCALFQWSTHRNNNFFWCFKLYFQVLKSACSYYVFFRGLSQRWNPEFDQIMTYQCNASSC